MQSVALRTVRLVGIVGRGVGHFFDVLLDLHDTLSGEDVVRDDMADRVVRVTDHGGGSEVAVDLRRSLSNDDDTSLLSGRGDSGREGVELTDKDRELLLVGGLGEEISFSVDASLESMIDLDERRASARDGGGDLVGDLDANLSTPLLSRRDGEASDTSDLVAHDFSAYDLGTVVEAMGSEEGLHVERDEDFTNGLRSAVDDRNFELSSLSHVGHRSSRDGDSDVLIGSEDGFGLVAGLGVQDRLKSSILNRHLQGLSDRLIESHGDVNVALSEVAVGAERVLVGRGEIRRKNEFEGPVVTARCNDHIAADASRISVKGSHRIEVHDVRVVAHGTAVVASTMVFSPMSFGRSFELDSNSSDLEGRTNVEDECSTNGLSREVDSALKDHAEGAQASGLGRVASRERSALGEDVQLSLSRDGEPHIYGSVGSDVLRIECGSSERDVGEDADVVPDVEGDRRVLIRKSKDELFVPLWRERKEGSGQWESSRNQQEGK